MEVSEARHSCGEVVQQQRSGALSTNTVQELIGDRSSGSDAILAAILLYRQKPRIHFGRRRLCAVSVAPRFKFEIRLATARFRSINKQASKQRPRAK